MAETSTIYVLQCEGGFYYVGKTERPLDDRVAEHFAGSGCEWTRIHPPVRVTASFVAKTPYDEDNRTKDCMCQHGIDRVRGGSYVAVVLPDYQRMALQDELCTGANLCFRCGQPGHYVADCRRPDEPRRHPLQQELSVLLSSDSESDDSGGEESDYVFDDGQCFRCGRYGHFAAECYEETMAGGAPIPRGRR